MFSVYFHKDPGGQEKERKEKKEKTTYQQVSKPCLYCKIPSAKPNQLAFRKKKNLILFLSSNNSVPVAAVTLLNF